MWTNASFGLGSGTETLTSFRTSGPPVWDTCIALMIVTLDTLPIADCRLPIADCRFRKVKVVYQSERFTAEL
jgi:hypothetical protein